MEIYIVRLWGGKNKRHMPFYIWKCKYWWYEWERENCKEQIPTPNINNNNDIV